MALLLFYLYRTSTKSFITIFTHAVSYVYTVREMVNNDDRNRKKKIKFPLLKHSPFNCP